MTELSKRQREVLELVAEGDSNKIIAYKLGLSDHTAKVHVHNALHAMGVTNRTEACAAIWRARLEAMTVRALEAEGNYQPSFDFGAA